MKTGIETAASEGAAGPPMDVVFDVRRLYYMTQFHPVFLALQRRGVHARFVGHTRRGSRRETLERAFADLGLEIALYESQAEVHAHHRREEPDWIVLGQGYPDRRGLPPRTRTAMLYHGIGMKQDVYQPGLVHVDVRFIEGPHYTAALRARYPAADLVEVGYAKVDPLFWPQGPARRFDLAQAGLDPRKPTLLFAPTHSPSCFPNMADRWPQDFADFNLIVKPHENSYTSSQRLPHRRKMDAWRSAPNVYVAEPHEYDPIPFMAVSDLLISDASSVLFEFAATGRPVVQCDFLKLPLRQRGIFRRRLRMDPSIAPYAGAAAHAARYRDLRAVVEQELAEPDRRAAERERATRMLIGPTDGLVSERIANHLLRAARRSISSGGGLS